MNLTKMSVSYFFLATGILAIIFYVYFKILSIKTSPDSKNRDKVLGDMKDVDSWTEKNKRMEYLALSWAIISIGIFVFLKFFYTAALVSALLPFIYLALVVISIILFMPKKRVF